MRLVGRILSSVIFTIGAYYAIIPHDYGVGIFLGVTSLYVRMIANED